MVGTAPPAQGATAQSGFGSGQYDGRSTWADAGDAARAESMPKRRPMTAAEAAERREGATKRMCSVPSTAGCRSANGYTDVSVSVLGLTASVNANAESRDYWLG